MKITTLLLVLIYIYPPLPVGIQSGRILERAAKLPISVVSPGTQNHTFRSHDEDVLEVVLKDLITNNDYKGTEGASRVLLELLSAGKPGVFEQWTNALDKEKGQTIPNDIQEDLTGRNRSVVDWSKMKRRRSAITIVDIRKIPDPLDLKGVFKARNPAAKGYITAWLPGYSHDGRTVVVRFRVYPSPHGGTGTYMLEKRKTWQVKWKHIAYFT